MPVNFRPEPLPDSSDEDVMFDSASSEDDGSGTLLQSQGKKARRQRRRAHYELMKRIQRERKGIEERVKFAVSKAADVMNSEELEGQKEEALELRQTVSEILNEFQDINEQSGEEIKVLNEWFKKMQTVQKNAGSGPGKDRPAVDLDDFDVEQVNEMFSSMTGSRDKCEHTAHNMIEVAISMMNNDDSKQLLHEQQVRFVEEVNTLVKSLERVESHAKGLTQNNIDLRLQLKKALDELRDWERKFHKVENTKESMVRQMEIGHTE